MDKGFITIEPGIRKKPDGSYVVTKSIQGGRHYKTTDNLAAARKWKKYFIPITNSEAEIKLEAPTASFKLNGRELTKIFRDVWEDYQLNHLSKKSRETQYRIKLRVESFTTSLLKVRMCEINEDTILAVINERKLLIKNKKRCNFDNELKRLSHIFKWYSLNREPFFESPIKDYHKRIGKVKDVPEVDKHIGSEDVKKFINSLPAFWYRFSVFQFYMAGRVQEPAGLTWSMVDRPNRRIRVEYVMTWTKGKPELKKTTKTGAVSYVYINDHMMELLDELELEKATGSDLVFHKNGQPLIYNEILSTYNQYLLVAGITKYSGTHILRYGMAVYSGELLGDEGSKAATRHGTMAMARKYRGTTHVYELTDENRQVVIHAEELFKKTV